MNTEPRFLLDEDSICYGCPEYKHVSETDIQMHLGDVDENGGVCDSSQMCINGDFKYICFKFNERKYGFYNPIEGAFHLKINTIYSNKIINNAQYIEDTNVRKSN